MRWRALPVVVLLLAFPAACGGGNGGGEAGETEQAAVCEPVGDLADADTTVAVELSEFLINVMPPEAPAGAVGFDASNIGGDTHELVVIRTDTDPANLPTREDGGVDEDAIDGEVVGEIEEFPAQSDCHGVFDLDPGAYALICNIVEEEEGGEIESHYAEGMHTGFTVTG